MAEQKHVRFAELLGLHIDNTIKRQFVNGQLTEQTLFLIRETIRDTITRVFEASNHKLGTEALHWLTDQYFKSIKINGNQSIGDMVSINEYKLTQLQYTEVELLRNLFNQTAMAQVLEAEYRRRVLA